MNLIKQNVTPPKINLIDVGSKGCLPFPLSENSNEIHFVLNFEPRDKHVKKENSLTLDTVLWEASCEKAFYIYKGLDGTGSSLFQQNFEYVKKNYDELKMRGSAELASSWFERSQIEQVVNVKCRKLDDVLSELDLDVEFHFLKIDAQGAEYQVLKGAEQFLSSHCLGLHIELFNIPVYKGITLLPEVSHYLTRSGFKLAKKYSPAGTFHCCCDCVFIKEEDNPITQKIRRIYHA